MDGSGWDKKVGCEQRVNEGGGAGWGRAEGGGWVGGKGRR